MVMAHGMSTVGGGRREKVMITGWEGGLSWECRMSLSPILGRQCRVGRHVGDMSPARQRHFPILGADNVVSLSPAADTSALRT